MVWYWSGDNVEFINFEKLWLRYNESLSRSSMAAYNFSTVDNRWGLVPVNSSESAAYICEISKRDLYFVKLREINIDYGITVTDPEKIERGPVFELEPKSQIFDLSKRDQSNAVSFRCAAKGYPMPEYQWFKEEYNQTKIVSKLIDPLKDER